MSKKKREVEWSFDFENIGSRVNQFFNDVIGKDIELETAELSAPLDGATSAVVSVDFSVGRSNVVALAPDSENLFEAQITYLGEYEFSLTGDSKKRILLRQTTKFPRGLGRMFGNTQDLVWDIALSQKVPHTLQLKGGVGEADMDLTNLTINKLKMDTGVGKVTLTLPIQETEIDVDINGGVGETNVIVPAGVAGEIAINGGVGTVDIVVAPSAAIRIKADSGLGDIRVPKSFRRVSGEGHFIGTNGVWETPNFADSSDQLIIDYDGGVGSFQLKYFEVV